MAITEKVAAVQKSKNDAICEVSNALIKECAKLDELCANGNINNLELNMMVAAAKHRALTKILVIRQA